MKEKLRFAITTSVVFGLISMILLIMLLHKPSPVRLHGTYYLEEERLVMVFLTDIDNQTAGKYAIYPEGHPYEAEFLKSGRFLQEKNGAVTLNSNDGDVGYAIPEGNGLLWLINPSMGITQWTKYTEAAVHP